MSKLKIVEVALLAVSSLVAAAKAFVKFLIYIGNLKAKTALST